MGLQLYNATGGDTFVASGSDPDQGLGAHDDVYTYTVDLGAGGTLTIGGDWGNPSSSTGGNVPFVTIGEPTFGTYSLDGSTGVFSYTLTRAELDANGGNQTISFTVDDANVGVNDDIDTVNIVITCFAAGSQIATPDGETSVEALAIGDKVRSATGENVSVKWIGRQTVRKLFSGPRMQPVRISAGALGAGLPLSDLTVTADHGMVIDGFVINAAALVNGSTIDFVPMAELPDQVTYYHIETEHHDVILANGAPAETFVDMPGRKGFDNYQEYLDLYGAERLVPDMGRPRISSQRLLPGSIKARLGIEEPAIDWDLPIRA